MYTIFYSMFLLLLLSAFKLLCVCKNKKKYNFLINWFYFFYRNYNNTRIPGLLGFVDGTNVKIKIPVVHEGYMLIEKVIMHNMYKL